MSAVLVAAQQFASANFYPLGDVCKTTSGGTPSRSKPEYFQGSIPWVKSGELPDGLVTKNSEYISDEAIRNSSAKLLPAGTLLIALYGATVGKLGILSRPAATNQAVCAIFPSEALDTKFLFWYLLSKRPYLIGQAAGGAQPNISQGVVRNLLVPVPTLREQHEIVAEIEKQFSRLDEAVANLKRVKANLKRYKASVLKDAVEGRLVPTEAELARREGRSFEAGAQLLQRILETRRSQWKGIRAERGMPIPPTDKTVANVDVNQSLLIRALTRVLSDQPQKILLDGHFVLRNTSGGVECVSLSVFRDLGIKKLICFRDDPSEILARLRSRDGSCDALTDVAELQAAELEHAGKVSNDLGVDLLLLDAFDANGLVTALAA